MTETKPVVMDKHLFENRYESFLILIFGKFWTNMFLMQASLSRGFSIESSSTGVRLSTEILFDELRPIRVEKSKIE